MKHIVLSSLCTANQAQVLDSELTTHRLFSSFSKYNVSEATPPSPQQDMQQASEWSAAWDKEHEIHAFFRAGNRALL